MSSKALVILSGGQDSVTCLFWAKARFDHVEALTFDYGQRHSIELECARKICADHNIPHHLLPLPTLSAMNPNALTDRSVDVQGTTGYQNLPSTFVPGRNILFLTLSAAFGVTRGFRDLVLGVCQTDYSGYPDCREEFVASMEKAISLGLDTPVVVHRPLMHLTKAETFQLAATEGVLDLVIRESHTCYEGDREHFHAWGYRCGKCPACELRRKGFEEFQKEQSHG